MKNLKFLLSGLISNDTVIQGKKKKWWFALIVVLVSLALSLIPSVVSITSSRGDTILTNETNYNLDKGIELFTDYLNADSTRDLKINENCEMEATNFTTFVATYQEDDILEVHYLDSTDRTVVSEYEEKLQKSEYADNFIDGTEDSSVTSYILFTRKAMYIRLYAKDAENVLNTEKETIKTTAKVSASFGGTYDKLANTSLKSLIDTSSSSAHTELINNWKVFLNKAYEPSKTASLYLSIVMMLGLNVLVILIISVSLLILGHNKSVPAENKINYLDSLKIVCFASLSPAILTAIVGSIFTAFASVAFVLFVGLRITWIGMKISRPAQQ